MNALLAVSALALAAMDPGHSDHHSPQLGNVSFETSCAPAAQGQFEDGLKWLHSFEYRQAELKFGEAASADPPSPTVAYAVTAIPARVLLERSRWKEAAAFNLPPNLAKLTALSNHVWAIANVHFAKAVGAARSGDRELARTEVSKLAELERTLVIPVGEYDWGKQVSIERQIAQAWLARAEGDTDGALRLMRGAADLDDATEKHPVTPGAILPAREQLGALLLDLGRPADALREYQASLQRAPRRLAGLHGAAQSAKLAGDRAAAERYFAELGSMTKDGNGDRAEIRDARLFEASLRTR